MSRTGDPGSEERVRIRFTLRLGDDQLHADVEVPTRRLLPVDLLPVLQTLTNQITALAERKLVLAGKSVSCAAGCGACCRQLVPISEPEAQALAAVVEAMPEPRRTGVRERFEAANRQLDERGLRARLPRGGSIEDPEARERLGLRYFAEGIPCPFLEDESCSIHASRPLACREYLVSSPPERCAEPARGEVERVPMGARLTSVLYRFGRDGEPGRVSWMPLVFALEWAAENRPPGGAGLSGPDLLRRFVDQLTGA